MLWVSQSPSQSLEICSRCQSVTLLWRQKVMHCLQPWAVSPPKALTAWPDACNGQRSCRQPRPVKPTGCTICRSCRSLAGMACTSLHLADVRLEGTITVDIGSWQLHVSNHSALARLSSKLWHPLCYPGRKLKVACTPILSLG